MRRMYEELARSRAAAKALGMRYYYTGIACPRGHVCPRRTSDYDCVGCHRERHRLSIRGGAKKFLGDVVGQRRRRLARVRSGGEGPSEEEIAEIRRLQGDRCAGTGCRVKLMGKGTTDHITPLALGGSNDRRNIQLLCLSCNSRKNAKLPELFARENGFLV